MFRSRAARLAISVAAGLALGSLVVVTSFSHEDDDVPPGPPPRLGPGPDLGRPIAMPAGLVGLEIALRQKDGQATSWEGEVKVSEGRVVSVEIERAGPNPVVEGGRFRVATTKGGGAAKAKKQALQKKKAQAAAQVAPLLHVTLDAPADAVVTVSTSRGNFDVKPADVARGQAVTFLDDLATVRREDAAVRLTGPNTEDDFPAMAKGPDGTVWLVNVAYRPEQPHPLDEVGPEKFELLTPTKHGDQIMLRRFDGKAWQPAIAVTEKRQDVWRPAVAVDGKGAVRVAWAQPIDGDWEIVHRTYTPPRSGDGEGSWSDVVRDTRAPGSDFHVVATTDSKGTVWLAWQGWRKDNYEILTLALKDGDDRTEPRVVSTSPANDWGPSIAADGKGGVFVAWDTYDKGNYDVRLRDVSGDGRERVVADSARFEARPHLACGKDGRLWIAYEQGDEQWGKDYAHAGNVTNVGLEKNPGFALYVNRTVRVKCLDDGKLMQPAGSPDQVFGPLEGRSQSVPRLGIDDDGGVWLLFRHHPTTPTGGEVWVGAATRYDGKAWSPLRTLPGSTNLIDNRPGLAAVSRGMLAVYSGDHRTQTQNRDQDDLFATRLISEGTVARVPDLEAGSPTPEPTLETVHKNESEDVARMRAYRVEHGGKSLRLLRGEFHRHTEYTSHNDQDGLLEDAWRYALDAGRLDWMGDGDHDNGFGHEYLWWTIQKVADLHLHEPVFVAAQTYERSVVFPNGHRNVMMPKTGHPPPAARRAPRHRRRGDARHQAALSLPETLRRHLRLAHQRHQHGDRLARQRPLGRAGRRGLPGTPAQLRALRRPSVADRGDPDRRLPALRVHLERPGEGVSSRLPVLERPRQHPPELRHRAHRRRLAPRDHRGVQEAALLRGDRQHRARRPQRRAPDGGDLRHEGEAVAGDRRPGDRSGGQGPRDPRQQVRLLDRAERNERQAPLLG